MKRAANGAPFAAAPVFRPRRKRLRAVVYVISAGLLALFVWCGGLFFVIGRFGGEPADGLPATSDVGIVLGASLWDNKPSPGLRERLDQALSLYKANVFRRLIVTGGLDAGGAVLTEAEGMRDYLRERGVPASAIVIEPRATSTYENLKYSKAIMDAQGWRTAVIVTHQYHGARSLDIAEALGYERPQVSVTDSKVMNMAYHRTREVLAYTKWLLQKWL
ncbi:YdcF family protein [Cohnella rhizosphaerae]|uniref:YdcF family protein n=1 Tax=Cohnella rhizosphaerae TaxID=1457232 RepID=A0A9X4KY49_9BACL|nr:YdcF family protein [Cohnella rhizosphaerae]MDG0813002.1 YdcF family protein [Cohnella rhizosphaerae]